MSMKLSLQYFRFRRTGLLLFALAALVLSGCGELVPRGKGWVEGFVVDKKGGDPVAGVQVENPDTKVKVITDAQGHYRIQVPAGVQHLVFHKAGHASARVEGLLVKPGETAYYGTILRPAFDPALPTTPPRLVVSNPYVQDGKAHFTVRVEVAAPNKNALYFTDIAIGAQGGSSGYLNGTVRHQRFFDYQGEHQEMTLSTEGLSGLVPIYVVAYDMNLNRSEAIRYVFVPPAAAEAPTAPENLSAYAVTFGDVSVFGTLGHFSMRRAVELLQKGDLKTLAKMARAARQAPLEDPRLKQAVSWVELSFTYPEDAPAPDYFEIWRKLSDEDAFHRIAQVATTDLETDDGYLYRDASPGVEPGVELSYKVVAVKGDARAESAVVQAKILEPFYVYADSPADHATGVALEPLYQMRVENSADLNLVAVVVIDRIQTDNPVFAFRSPVLVLRGADGPINIPHGLVYLGNGQYGIQSMPLLPNHAYDWQPIALTLKLDDSGNPVAVSVAADFFNFVAKSFGVPFAVEDGPVNTFVTGAGNNAE